MCNLLKIIAFSYLIYITNGNTNMTSINVFDVTYEIETNGTTIECENKTESAFLSCHRHFLQD
jgi:hypothetical protein